METRWRGTMDDSSDTSQASLFTRSSFLLLAGCRVRADSPHAADRVPILQEQLDAQAEPQEVRRMSTCRGSPPDRESGR